MIKKERKEKKSTTQAGVRGGLPVVVEGGRRQLHLDQRHLGLHPLRERPALGVHHQPLPVPPEPGGGDGGLRYGDALAGLDGVYEDGRHRRRRLPRRPLLAAGAEEGGEEGRRLLHIKK